jgi:hypothetical protein
MNASPLEVLEVVGNRLSEETPLAMEQVFAAFANVRREVLWRRMFWPGRIQFASFEIASINSQIHFYIVIPQHLRSFIEGQLTAQYPRVVLMPKDDYLPHFVVHPHAIARLRMWSSYYYPLKTFADMKDVDLMAAVLGQLAKTPPDQAVAIQFRVTPAGRDWQAHAASVIRQGVHDPSSPTGRSRAHPDSRIIETKINASGLRTGIRILTAARNEAEAFDLLTRISGSFGVYTMGEGNSLFQPKTFFWQRERLTNSMLKRGVYLTPRNHVLNTKELASLWHPPGMSLATIKSIQWGRGLLGEPPQNLPVATSDEAEKKTINFFARSEWRNQQVTFGIKEADRRKHMYIIGKTGTGKSTTIANMAINDMKNGAGMAIIDPHGDLSEILLDYIPSHRINDVAYLDPADSENPFYLNPLEVKNPTYRELVASGIVSIFYKLYHMSWGPRLEYILRNTILTLTRVPDSTFLDIPELLTNELYRGKIIEKLDDQVLKNFWVNEFNKFTPRLHSESTSPILNKVGQFLSSQTIRNIVGHPHSTIDLEDMMNQGKIVIINLSQGKLGEDSSALLGAMIITKMQLAAMNRVYIPEAERRDFYLYVDEFQNFATQSFIKILSEARKYRLNLTLANQYIGQIDEEVQKAIFGNAGSLISFGVGAADARLLTHEFGSKYEEQELVGLGNYQIVLKLSIDNQTSLPFAATTLPLPLSRNQNREKVVRSSRERYTKKVQ